MFVSDCLNVNEAGHLTIGGADTVLLEVRSSNTAAIRLYEEYGFVKTGIRKGYYDNKEDALIMCKNIE